MSPSTPISKSQQKSKLVAQARHQREPSYPSSNNSFRDVNNNSLASSGDIAVLPHSSSSYLDCAFNEKLSQHSVDSHNSNLDMNLISSPTSSSFSQADYIDEVIKNNNSLKLNLRITNQY